MSAASLAWLPVPFAARNRLLVGLLLGLLTVLTTCREASRKSGAQTAQPIRDPRWIEPAALAAEASTTLALGSDSSPVVLPPPFTPTAPPEDPSIVAAKVETHDVEALGLAFDMPGPATSVAAGMGASETWVFERPIVGFQYGLSVSVSRRALATAQELAMAATEIGSRGVALAGEATDIAWVVKEIEGPVQQVWVARWAGKWAMVAVCAAPPMYLELALAACKTLRAYVPPEPKL